MILAECLHFTPLRTLLAICQANGFGCDRHASKASLESVLVGRLARFCQPVFLSQLPASHLNILSALAHCQGQMPLGLFEASFGLIRPYRPWRSDAPRHPWRAPVSLSEELIFRGLIFVIRLPGQPAQVVLPDEIALVLQEPEHPTPSLAPGPEAGSWLLDLVLFLVYLQQVDVRPIHGRWLSVHHCRQLGACLSPPLQGAWQSLPSERHATRIAFLHYLAERLNLLTTTAGLLKPSPSVATWLAQDPAELLATCWRSWLAPDEANRHLWRRFRLPGYTLRDPAGFVRRFVNHLAGVPSSLSSVAAQSVLAELLPWWEREQDVSALQTLIAALLTGPLVWLDVVETSGAASDPSTSRLTPWGAWLCGGNGAARPDDFAVPSLTDVVVSLDGVATNLPSVLAVLAIAPWCDLQSGPCLCLTPASLTRALAQGAQLSDLFALWQRWLTSPLSSEQQALLRTWANVVRWAELRSALLLHTNFSSDLDALWEDRAARSHLDQRLAGDLASVRSSDPVRLVRALQARNVVLRRSDLASTPTPTADQPTLTKGDHWWLYTAALLHRDLASRLGLPSPPGATLAALQAILGPAELAAARAAAQAASEALQHVVDGPAGLPVHILLEQVEECLLAAIEAGELVRLVYWSPWHHETTQRCVRPLQLQWRGDHRYLVAFCLLANAERTFRLDRIIDLTQCDTA